ncbi:polysaccharide pyruvyl transferase family protein, partial [Patescibacteria group bacterium]|nr:polysaccharide pyruvyl transferase family protein [Patescibacteria group bacterium]
CSVLQDINNVVHKGQNLILVFRGRRDVVRYELEQIKRSFSTKKIILASSFWKFDHDKPINTGSLSTLQELLQQALLVVSSSFHGIIFSIRFGIPFIPIETMATRKNLSVSYDVLGTHYKQMDFSAWLEFYKDKGNYNDIERHLIKVLPQLQKRALVYSQ